MTDHSRLEAAVYGRVQGVGFRWFVQRTARRLELHGWTANQPDGSVHVVAEGPRAVLDELEKELHSGPAGSSVERVDVRQTAPTGEFDGFAIRAGGHRGD